MCVYEYMYILVYVYVYAVLVQVVRTTPALIQVLVGGIATVVVIDPGFQSTHSLSKLSQHSMD